MLPLLPWEDRFNRWGSGPGSSEASRLRLWALLSGLFTEGSDMIKEGKDRSRLAERLVIEEGKQAPGRQGKGVKEKRAEFSKAKGQ